VFVEIKVLSCVSESRAIFLFVILIFGAPFNFFIYIFSVERSGGGYYFGGGVTTKIVRSHCIAFGASGYFPVIWYRKS
jgi:hypothetical protein